MVVVAAGLGLTALFAAEGAVVVDGGPTNNPSTAEVLAAIRATGAGRVVAAAERLQRAGRGGGRRRRGARGRDRRRGGADPVAGAGAGGHGGADSSRRFHDEVIAMAEAAGACRYARGDHRYPGGADRGRAVPGRRRARARRGRGEPDRPGPPRHVRRRCSTGCWPAVASSSPSSWVPTRPPAWATCSPEHVTEHWPFVEVQLLRGRATPLSAAGRCGMSDAHDHIGHTAGQGGRGRAKVGKKLTDAFGMHDRAGSGLPLSAPVRRARRADRHRQPDGGRGGHDRRPRCCGRNARSMQQRKGWIVEVLVGDGSGRTLALTFFTKSEGPARWRASQLPVGKRALFAGTVSDVPRQAAARRIRSTWSWTATRRASRSSPAR